MNRILIADDDLVSCQLLKRTLESWGYAVVVVHNGIDALNQLMRADAPRLAILDWVMPGMDGPEVIRQVRARNEEPYTYTMLLTSRSQKNDLIEGMDAGADDYLSKPFDTHELRVRLRAGSRLILLQQELISAREALRIQATRDALTDVLNRRAILDRLDAYLEDCRLSGATLGVLMLDLDHFKQINDTFGHLGGDAALIEGCARMRSLVRAGDDIGRFGGEEFLILLPGCDSHTTLSTAERLRMSLCSAPMMSGAHKFRVTCSIGASLFNPADPLDARSLIQDADQALYRSKETGRNRVTAAWEGLEAPQKIAS